MKRAFLIGIIVLLATHLVVAQTAQQPRSPGQPAKAEPEGDETISFDAALVNTHVSVRDAQGHFVSGLTRDDFIVLDDGREQPLTYFSQESNQPLRVAFDRVEHWTGHGAQMSPTVRRLVEQAKTAAA